MTSRIHAPFTHAEVRALIAHQESNLTHNYTCGNRDERHQTLWGDLGSLIPTESGLWCPTCGTYQTWAWQP